MGRVWEGPPLPRWRLFGNLGFKNTGFLCIIKFKINTNSSSKKPPNVYDFSTRVGETVSVKCNDTRDPENA